MSRRTVLALLVSACCLLLITRSTAHTPDPNDPIQGLAPVLKVADIGKAIDYYKNTLGFHEDFRAGEPANYAGVGRGMVQFHLSTGKYVGEKGSVYLFVKG